MLKNSQGNWWNKKLRPRRAPADHTIVPAPRPSATLIPSARERATAVRAVMRKLGPGLMTQQMNEADRCQRYDVRCHLRSSQKMRNSRAVSAMPTSLVQIPMLKPVNRSLRRDRRGRIALGGQGAARVVIARMTAIARTIRSQMRVYLVPCLPPGARSMSLGRALDREAEDICDRRHLSLETWEDWNP